MLAPLQFVPMAESTGLMSLLTDWVLEEALSQRQRWQHAGIDLDVAVNLSMSGLHESGLVDTTQTLLQRYDVPAAALRLEITETALMRDAARTLEILTRLADFGAAWLSTTSAPAIRRWPISGICPWRSSRLTARLCRIW